MSTIHLDSVHKVGFESPSQKQLIKAYPTDRNFGLLNCMNTACCCAHDQKLYYADVKLRERCAIVHGMDNPKGGTMQ